ncbi:hypothetical protein CNMCM6069_000023 [Aspergillus lentulus]|nr:hypothetical protein CNMCM6069_000023 [Aspergillus lentulus]KAF4189951.1 hypothetical protein CNMCM7927_005761 [Aspergillus lentulus]
MLRNASESLAHFNRALPSIGQKFPAHRDSSFYQYDWPGLLTAFAYEPSNPTLDSFEPESLIVLLSMHISVLVLGFALRRNNFDGPRFPKSVGSQIPWGRTEQDCA